MLLHPFGCNMDYLNIQHNRPLTTFIVAHLNTTWAGHLYIDRVIVFLSQRRPVACKPEFIYLDNKLHIYSMCTMKPITSILRSEMGSLVWYQRIRLITNAMLCQPTSFNIVTTTTSLM